MKTLLICHEGAEINQLCLALWLSSFSELAGMVVLQENFKQKYRQIKREIQRSRYFRFLDILIMRLYYNLFLKRKDKHIRNEFLRNLYSKYKNISFDPPIL